jgi:hypothetical protein
MIKHETISLGTKLLPILGSGFFRPLTRPTAPIYIDCAERLAEAADEGGQVAHAEARLLIREVLTNHPDVQLDDDEGGQLRDLNQRAAQFFNKLIESHWLEPRAKIVRPGPRFYTRHVNLNLPDARRTGGVVRVSPFQGGDFLGRISQGAASNHLNRQGRPLSVNLVLQAGGTPGISDAHLQR